VKVPAVRGEAGDEQRQHQRILFGHLEQQHDAGERRAHDGGEEGCHADDGEGGGGAHRRAGYPMPPAFERPLTTM
jgi:hypothetical protein